MSTKAVVNTVHFGGAPLKPVITSKKAILQVRRGMSLLRRVISQHVRCCSFLKTGVTYLLSYANNSIGAVTNGIATEPAWHKTFNAVNSPLRGFLLVFNLFVHLLKDILNLAFVSFL